MSSESLSPGPDRYQYMSAINSGSFGRVHLARDTVTDELVAIKQIDRGDKITRHVMRELINHRDLSHPHVIRFIGVYLTDEHLCIVMEYAPGGNLKDYMKGRAGGVTEDEARWFFQQLILGIDYCHDVNVVNRDVKIENALLMDNKRWPVLKICDFGFSKNELLNSAPDSRVGTPAYLAPEIVTHSSGNVYDGKAADVWCAGVFLFKLLTGFYPFERPEDEKLGRDRRIRSIFERIMSLDYHIPVALGISPSARDLIGRIFVRQPLDRITVKEIMDHPWFNISLPKGAKEMNKKLWKQNMGVQSVDSIVAIVQKAKLKASFEP